MYSSVSPSNKRTWIPTLSPTRKADPSTRASTPISRPGLSVVEYRITDGRAITVRPAWVSCEITASCIPCTRYSWSGSFMRLPKGNTANRLIAGSPPWV